MKFFEERHPKYDALVAGFAISLVYFGSYGMASGITAELFIVLPIVFVIASLANYYYFDKRVKEDAKESRGRT
jgi:hypothetical protein